MIVNKIRTLAFVMAALSLVAGGLPGAHAQAYPDKPVRMIVPFGSGGVVDALARVLALHLGERLGQTVVVEFRPGGGGIVGTEAATRSQPDGYTVLLGSPESYGMTYSMQKRLPYNPEKDLLPVAKVSFAPLCFAVHPSIAANTVNELIAYARANPGKLRFGSPGIGTNPHLTAEQLKSRFNIDLVHVPYKTGGAGIIDLISGQIEMIVTGANVAAPRMKAGQIRVLALTGSQRSPLMPEVPTMAEAGVPDFVMGALFGMFVPGGTPPHIAARLARDVVAVSQMPKYRTQLAAIGQEVAEPLTDEAFGAYVKNEARRWRELAERAGVKDE